MATKKKKESTALAVIEDTEFPVLAVGADAKPIGTQLRDMGVSRFDLSKVTVPSAGAVAFEVETLEDVEYFKELRVVIAYSQSNQRSWHRTSIEDSDGHSAPDCSSEDGINGYGVNTLPAEGIEAGSEDDAQREAHDCVTCPWNEWESARGGSGNAKDCSEYIVLYAFGEDSLVPFVMQVPPTSLKAARKYSLRLLGAGKKLGDVVTVLTLEKKESPVLHSVINFKYGGPLSPEAAKRMETVEEDMRTAFASVAPKEKGPREPESQELD